MPPKPALPEQNRQGIVEAHKRIDGLAARTEKLEAGLNDHVERMARLDERLKVLTEVVQVNNKAQTEAISDLKAQANSMQLFLESKIDGRHTETQTLITKCAEENLKATEKLFDITGINEEGGATRFRDNMSFLQNRRLGWKNITETVIKITIGAAVVAVLSMFVIGFQAKVNPSQPVTQVNVEKSR